MMGTRRECINGTVRGVLDDGIASFKGIPYTGEPPVEKNRWMPPVPYGIADRFIDADSFAASPPQRSNGKFPTSEDCLRLNIWANTKDETERKPVILWIHGGFYTAGSTSHPMYSGMNFVRESPDIIFVSAGYRLGALGFMDVSAIPGGEDLDDSANLGIMDLGMALKWVYENIGSFGGDRENITLMGQSAGAACATLLASNEEYGRMVRRVIAESGSPSFSNGVGLSPQVGAYIAKKLGCTDMDGMRSIHAEILGELSESLSMKVWPIRNGKTVPKDPYEELGKRRIDILAGSNLNEMETFASSMGKDMLVDTTRRTVSSLPEKEKRIATEFLGSGDDIGKYMILANGSLFSAPAEMLALQATRSGGKGYRYVWTAETGRPGYGAYHGAEMPAILRNRPNEQTHELSLEAHRMWVSFARNGVPSEDWPVCEEEDRAFMTIGGAGFKASRDSLPKIIRGFEGKYLL